MIEAIAKLKSLVDPDTELIELNNNQFWSKKIDRAIVDSASCSHLVLPATITKLAEVIKLAQQQQWRILICGNGTKLDWGYSTSKIDLVVSTQKCDRLIEHAVGDLTVTVEAGMKLADLQAKLKVHQQFLAIDPVYPQQATIGGIIATADTGSWRQRYGGIRDMLLGISFVRADGEMAKAGGRVVKNVAGYDLMKLFTGAYGTLGIITQATFRTYPLPPASKTLLLQGKAANLATATQAIRSSSLSPTAMDLVSAAVMTKLELGNDMGLLVRFQTIAESIEQQSEKIVAIAKENELTVSYLDKNEIDLWQKLSEIVRIPHTETAIVAKIGIAPNAAIDLLLKLADNDRQNLAVIHTGSGVGHVQLPKATTATIQILRTFCQERGGYLTLLNAPQAIERQIDIWGYSGNAINVMKAIANKFDPSQILNPGRFVGKI
ncbi:FAD-binding oxidoreductase [Myxosarcina sp. GI1]|uniref:FAD-binding oxidoreductase n=1 Tax=Myxosarcina sp. GI1 TaxID=1541065 RepID=UPI0005612A29|nr:FAD-binding oxidoreductase [Myxosarcina sp. GI1]